jgi:alpha/beta superfamily hydrolase
LARSIESLFIQGPAGRLEARLEEPETREPREVALVCHPHPQHGGTMLNKVVHRLARGLRRTGSVTLRFNFRGVNLSEGAYDHGRGELADAQAALEFLRGRYPALPFSVAGFSFGSNVALKLRCLRPEATRAIAVGFPVSMGTPELSNRCPVPRYFVQSTNDQFSPRAEFETFYESLPGEKRLMWVSAADHFFSDALGLFEETVTRL